MVKKCKPVYFAAGNENPVYFAAVQWLRNDIDAILSTSKRNCRVHEF